MRPRRALSPTNPSRRNWWSTSRPTRTTDGCRLRADRRSGRARNGVPPAVACRIAIGRQRHSPHPERSFDMQATSRFGTFCASDSHRGWPAGHACGKCAAAISLAPSVTTPSPATTPTNIPDKKLDAAAAAVKKVTVIKNKYDQQLAEAPVAEKERLQGEAGDAMAKAVTDQGLSIEEYTTILKVGAAGSRRARKSTAAGGQRRSTVLTQARRPTPNACCPAPPALRGRRAGRRRRRRRRAWPTPDRSPRRRRTRGRGAAGPRTRRASARPGMAIDHEPRANGSLPQRVAWECATAPRSSSP